MNWTLLIQVTASVVLFTILPGIPPNLEFSSKSITFGSFVLNDKLNNAERLFEGKIKGPEDFAIHNGELYTSAHGGYIFKIVKDKLIPVVTPKKQCKGLHEEHICGRPLGLKIKNGILYYADAYYGIFSKNLKTGETKQIISIDEKIDGKIPKLPNSLDISKDGIIYWTDSSTSYGINDGIFAILANGDGRVIRYDPATKTNVVLIDGLHFANGITLSDDEKSLIISETVGARYDLTKKEHKTFIANLPGLSDNILKDNEGNYIVSLIVPSSKMIAQLMELPLLRKFLARSLTLSQSTFDIIGKIYPHEIFDKIVHWIGHFEMITGHPFEDLRTTVLKINNKGVIVKSLHATDGNVSHVSAMVQLGNYYYLGSPYNNYIARVKIS